MNTNLLKQHLKYLEQQAKTASKEEKKRLRISYSYTLKSIAILEAKPKTMEDVVKDALF